MRKWLGQLRGGWLIAFSVPTYLVGFGLLWFGYCYARLPRNAFLALYEIRTPADSIVAAHQQEVLELRFVGAGAALCLLTLPVIWWWLSARRRRELPGAQGEFGHVS